MNVVHIIVHTPEQVRAIVREAASIADENVRHGDELGGEEWGLWFEQACALLGQRSTVVQADAPMPTIPPPYAGRR